VTAQDVCVPGYAKKVRAVPAWLKRQAYAEYGITQYKTGDYEVDYLIPLSLGGSNSIRNLWPQQNVALEVVCERCAREETPQARMRRPIGSQDRSKRDSVKLDRSLPEIRR
jgi:hypothetical protein